MSDDVVKTADEIVRAMRAVPEPHDFHWRDGVYFSRNPVNQDVRIKISAEHFQSITQQWPWLIMLDIPTNEWNSIVRWVNGPTAFSENDAELCRILAQQIRDFAGGSHRTQWLDSLAGKIEAAQHIAGDNK
jgi:hypothetical protein